MRLFYVRTNSKLCSGRVGDRNREDSRRKHIVRGHVERYEIPFNDKDYETICANVRNGTHTVFLKQHTLRCDLVAIFFRNDWLVAIVSDKRIETIVESEHLEPFRHLLHNPNERTV